MSAPSAMGPAAAGSAWPMYRSLVGVGLLCGVLIVSAYEFTKPIIARNRAEALQDAIFEVLTEARSSKAYRYDEGRGFALVEGEADGDSLVYAGYDDSGRLAGIAVEAQGMGYQDIVRVLYGYSPEQDAIVGLRVLESKETPGLGDKIITDEAFNANFKQLDVKLSSDGASLANAIVAVKNGAKQDAWEIDGITGATISSVAVADLLNASATTWAPLIERRLADFQEAR